LNIGQASALSGITAKMIRHYETLGLITPAARTQSNYRDFSAKDINDLRFIKRARSLGFSMEEIGKLLSLWRDDRRPSREVKALAQGHIAALEARISQMQAMADTLHHLVKGCAGDDRPDCPILTDLAAKP